MISKELAGYLRNRFSRGNVICLTGAGISAESGIPTFRGKGGLWQRYNPQTYATFEGLVSVLRQKPADFVDYVLSFYDFLLQAKPNPAHLALSALERAGYLKAVITQNIDNLHQEAGSRTVIELHGNSFRIRCGVCPRRLTLEKDRVREMVKLFKRHAHSYRGILKILSRYCPRCDCGGRFRIDIVMFGEMLPEDALSCAYRLLDTCDTLVVIGTSLAVYPAAGLPAYAKERKAEVIEINSERSPFSDICDQLILGKASDIMPEILATVG